MKILILYYGLKARRTLAMGRRVNIKIQLLNNYQGIPIVIEDLSWTCLNLAKYSPLT